MVCPICKEVKKKSTIKVKDYEYDIKFSAIYSECKYCGLIYRSKPSKLINEKNYYSKKKYLPVKGNFFYDLLKNIYANYEKKIILKNINNDFLHERISILDLACGKGFLIKKFSINNNTMCFGIDKNVHSKKNGNLKFFKSSYKNFKLIKKINPDIIIINNFLEHIEDLKIIKKLFYHMKKNSYLVIITPDSESCARTKFSNFWSGYHSPRHKVIFNQKNIKKIFNNFKKNKIYLTRMFDPFSNLISITNLVKQTFHNFKIKYLICALTFLPYVLIDFYRKNRLLLIVRKN